MSLNRGKFWFLFLLASKVFSPERFSKGVHIFSFIVKMRILIPRQRVGYNVDLSELNRKRVKQNFLELELLEPGPGYFLLRPLFFNDSE